MTATETNTYILSKPAALIQAIRLEGLLKSIKAEVEHAQAVVDASDDEQKRIMRHLDEGAITHEEATKAWDRTAGEAVDLSRQVLASLSAVAQNGGYLERGIEAVKQ